jgi:hypothetical protein
MARSSMSRGSGGGRRPPGVLEPAGGRGATTATASPIFVLTRQEPSIDTAISTTAYGSRPAARAHTQTSAKRSVSTSYKGLANYYDIGDTRNAAWSCRARFEEVVRIADFVSFYPEKVTITIDGEKLEPAPWQNVISHGPDRNLSVDEIGGIQLEEDAAAAET